MYADFGIKFQVCIYLFTCCGVVLNYCPREFRLNIHSSNLCETSLDLEVRLRGSRTRTED